MRTKMTDRYRVSVHFLDRYVERFEDNRLEVILFRINQLKPLTRQQYNRVKKVTQNCNMRDLMIDKDMVVLAKNKTLITCWRLP